MKKINSIYFKSGSNEEDLPEFSSSFPYISSCVQINRCPHKSVPWHWHQAVEIFYIKEGSLEYKTAQKTLIFPKGSGGFVNSNVLHTTKDHAQNTPTIQYLHIFDPSFIAGPKAG